MIGSILAVVFGTIFWLIARALIEMLWLLSLVEQVRIITDDAIEATTRMCEAFRDFGNVITMAQAAIQKLNAAIAEAGGFHGQ